MDVADRPSSYVHLAKACNGDARITDIFYLAILWWGGDDIEQFLRLVCPIYSQESGGRQKTSITFGQHKRLCKNDNFTCGTQGTVVKNCIKNMMSKGNVES